MNTEQNKKKWVEKCITALEMGGRSNRTIDNYKSAWNRFLHFFDTETNIKNLSNEKIVEYLKKELINKNRCADYYNLNVCAIRFFYSICFERELNKRIIPSSKLRKRIPTIVEKETFLEIFNNEKRLNHKCWLLLAFCSGLRVDEVATIRIEYIFASEHKLKVLGKGNKERYTILPDIVIKYLRLYCIEKNIKRKSGYLFEGTDGKEHVNSKTIINFFTNLKHVYNLDDNIIFHSLRHSFATYYLMNGGNLLTLQSLLGHKSLNSTTIYIHIAQNFNNLEGIKYV